jgi:hypothetical protein
MENKMAVRIQIDTNVICKVGNMAPRRLRGHFYGQHVHNTVHAHARKSLKLFHNVATTFVKI